MLKLKNLREDNDYTQKEIALYLNMERSVYAKIEDERITLLPIVVYKLSILYNVDPAYLLGYINTKRCFPKEIKNEVKRKLNIEL